MVMEFDKTKPVKLDLACGDNKREGFLGIDKYKTPSTDFELDLTTTNWPIEDNSVDELNCSHFFEHLHGHQRGAFMDECYRILKPGGKLFIIVPYWSSSRAVQDFTHQRPPVCEASFCYFSKPWREANKLTHGAYDLKSNFDFTCAYGLDQDVSTRHIDYQQAAVKQYLNSVSDLFVTLVKVVAPVVV